MAGTQTLTDQIRDWFDRSPKAQRAVKKLSEDLDIVAGKVEQATSGLMERVGPIIDPPSRLTSSNEPTSTSEAIGTDRDPEPVIPEAESSVPPGVKKEGEPVDPTT